jgi:16S rRNA (cytosine1402-N4)-methyltransferase
LRALGRRGGRLLAFDRDPDAITAAKHRFRNESRFAIERRSFAALKQSTDCLYLTGKIDGILLDLGVSSPQLEDPNRGFSFLKDGPLDMRMDPTQGISAAEWLAGAEEKSIAEVIQELGEERYARRIAGAIVRLRATTPIVTTRQLADLITQAVPNRYQYKHPATRTFQAIRMAINGELPALRSVLQQSLAILTHGGRLVVVSFHSLEDRLVKRFIRSHSHGATIPRGLPVRGAPAPGALRTIGRAKRASVTECQRNPRARSAILRVAERV